MFRNLIIELIVYQAATLYHTIQDMFFDSSDLDTLPNYVDDRIKSQDDVNFCKVAFAIKLISLYGKINFIRK